MNTILFHICFWLIIVAFIVIGYLVIRYRFKQTSPGRNVRPTTLDTTVPVANFDYASLYGRIDTVLIGGSGNRRRSAVYTKEPIKPIKCMGKHNFI